jgi:hypothetical protein
VERTNRFRVFSWEDGKGNRRTETRQVVIVRDADGSLNETFI